MASTFRRESVVKYTCPTKCYPRFNYFQQNYKDFLPELQKVKEYANLYKTEPPEHKSLTDRKYDSINVTVVCNELSTLKDLRRKLVKVKVDDVRRYSVKHSLAPGDKQFSLWSFDELEKKQRTRIYKSGLEITVFVINTMECLQYLTDMISRKMSEERQKNVVLHNENNDLSSTYEEMVKNGFKFRLDEEDSLSTKIQYILEYNIVSVLDEIVKFICHIEDVSKMPKTYVDSAHDRILEEVKNRRLGRVSLVYGMAPKPSSEYQKEHFREWPYKLQAKGEEFIRVHSPDTLAVDMSQSQFQDEEHLSDMSENPIEEDWEHSLQAQFEELSEEQSRDTLAGEMGELKIDILSMLQDEDKYFESRSNKSEEVANDLKKTMMKLKFEIFGLLRQTRIVQIRESVPRNPKLSSALKMEILKIPEIVGCGIAYGQIEMHISRKKHPNGPSYAIVNMVEQLLQEHNYSNSYTIELIGEKIELSFKQGDKTEASLIDKVEQKKETHFGTLGCFVNVKMANTDTLFGITCAHCVRNYDREIKIVTIDKKEITGIRSHAVHWEECHNVDIASIEIHRRDYEDCETSLQLKNYTKCQNWTFQEGYPDMGVTVYKRGYKTRLKQGRIHFSEHYDEDSDVNPILIKSCETVSALQQHLRGPFSAKGDSGSVVWYEYLGFSEEPVTTVIGIIFRGDENELDGTIESTYCCPIKPSIKKLEERFGEICKIEPARESSKT